MAGKKKKPQSDVKQLMDESSPFAIVEAYKALRTNVIFSLAGVPAEKRNNVVIVTSSLPGEGKSTTCANLALAMAQKDERVLIVDADLRKPTQNKIFKVTNNDGLSNALINEELSHKIHRDVRPQLDLLASGPIPPNPSELLSSQAMKAVIDALTQYYDYIFIDTPPINVVTDALVISPNASGLLVVVSPELCTHENMKYTLDAIAMADATLLGAVMTKITSDGMSISYKSKYSKYSKYRYYSKYGYRNGEKVEK
ncbi:MAG TPA: CpsD/CapB family tyrosine-protein kinase [Bacillota bacterium]|nr:CpsD/CapB family tyrosine-protein kinase [Bacillota bacterium]